MIHQLTCFYFFLFIFTYYFFLPFWDLFVPLQLSEHKASDRSLAAMCEGLVNPWGSGSTARKWKVARCSADVQGCSYHARLAGPYLFQHLYSLHWEAKLAVASEAVLRLPGKGGVRTSQSLLAPLLQAVLEEKHQPGQSIFSFTILHPPRRDANILGKVR